MAYNLSSNFPDQMSLLGHFVSSGKKWAHILYGRIGAIGPVTTSQNLLLSAHSSFTAGPTSIMQFMSQDVQLDQMTLKQVQSYHADVGTLTELSLTIAAGVITGVAIVNPGAGYANGTDKAIVVDYQKTGTGAVINLTYAGGVCTAATIVNGGVNYSASTFATAPLPDGSGPNRYDLVFGAQDFVGPFTDAGGINTDRATSFNAFSIKMRSGLAGRSGRGAAHWPGVAEAQTLLDNLTGATLAGMQPNVTDWFVNPFTAAPIPAGASWQPQILSQKQMRFTPPSTFPGSATQPFWLSPISTAVLNAPVGSMLRRKVKV